MQRYDEDTRALLPEEYATTDEACTAWAEEMRANGYGTLADRVPMYTRERGRWTRWMMRRTGDEAPAPQWFAEHCETATPPRPRCVHCDRCGSNC